LNRTQKSEEVDRLREALDGVPSVVLTDFQGLTVEKITELRREFRKASVRYEVVKNTLVRRAVAGTTMSVLDPLLHGNTAIAFHPEDPAAAAKILSEFVKTNEKLVIKGGWLSGTLLDTEGVKTLATMPGKDELRARLLSVFNGVPSQFVRLLNAAQSGFVRVLQARGEKLAG
jgi:large subunit ribosomal protein L10